MIQQGLALTGIGMGMVFIFLIILIFAMGLSAKAVQYLEKYYPEPGQPETAAADLSEIAIAIAVTSKFIKK